ncbi:MAG: heme ABC exporter ATP-binding protein CcmA [Rhodospirillaceae bacterium]
METQPFAPATFSGAGLACRRGGRLVFSGLGFSLASGDAMVLRGPNGSGKTTLLRLMAGLNWASDGYLAWNGVKVDDFEAHGGRLRFIGHLDAVKPALTVAENLEFWRNLWGNPASDVNPAAERLGLGRLAAFPARLLSAGQRHRLSLARLLVAPAPLWLLDEPGNALDDASLTDLAAIIAAHRARGGMVVIASHGAAAVTDGITLDVGAFTGATEIHWSEAV